MAVDRGGLRYTIQVDYDSANASRFRDDINAARAAFGEFRTSVVQTARSTQTLRQQFKRSGDASRGTVAALRAQAAALGQVVRAQRAASQALGRRESGLVRQLATEKAISAELRRRAASASTVLRTTREEAELVKRLRQELQLLKPARAGLTAETLRAVRAERALVRTLSEELALLNRLGRTSARGAGGAATGGAAGAAQSAEQAANATKKARDRMKALGTETDTTNNAVSRLFFTFRRLIGVFALFQAARVVTGSFAALIAGGVRFNAQIELAQTSISGLILSVAEVRDEQGRVVEGAEAFARAQGEAKRQTELLRRDAIKTTATFQELLDVFQIAVAPGVQAGLDLDEIRNLVVRVSQAAAALGVPQNQLSEEIRSLTTGVIRQQTSRIAVALGITPADIKRAKEMGTLAQFLEQRFQGIQIAGDKIEATLSGLANRIRDAFQSLSGAAGVGLFDELKVTLREVNDLITDPSTLKPNPDVLAAFAAVFAALTNILRTARRLAAGVGLERFRRTAEGIAKVVELAGNVLVGIISGFTRGFSLVVGLVSSLFALFGSGNVDIAQTVSLITEILVIVFALRGGWQAIVALTKLFNVQLSAANLSTKSLLLTLLGVPAALLAGLAAGTQLGNIIAGTNFKVVTIAKAIGSLLVSAFKTVVDAAELTFTFINQGFTFVANKAVEKFLKLLVTVSSKLAEFGTSIGIPKGVTDALEEFAGSANVAASQLAVGARKNTEAIKREFNELIAGTDRFGEGLNQVLAEAGEDPTVGELGAKLGNAIRTQLDQILGLLPADVDAGVREAIEAARKAVEDQGDIGSPLGLTPRGDPATDEQLDAIRGAQDRAAATQAEAEGLERINVLTAQRASQEKIALVEAENQLAALEGQQAALEEQNRIEFERNIQRLEGAKSFEEQFTISQEIDAQIAEQAAEEAKLSAEIDAANLKLEQQRLIMEGTATQGIGQALLDFPERIGTAFQAGLEIASQALDAFSELVADAIVDAFDPTNDTSFKERFARFLQGLAKQILQFLVQIAIAKAILGLNSLFGGGEVQGAGAVGLAEGGMVPDHGAATPAHFKRSARGYSVGGRVAQGRPPPGIDSHDTVPAWLSPGEYVLKRAAVRRYGSAVMSAINSGAADENLLRAAVGLRAARRARASVGPGFAEGGLVSDRAESAARAGEDQRDRQPVPAVVVADEATVSALWNGGRNTWLRIFRENGDAIDGAIRAGSRRTR